MFAASYATALTLGVPVIGIWPALLMTLVALVPGAAYVSVINDLTDLEDDRAAGKPNRLDGRPRSLAATILTVAIACGIAVAISWRGDPLLLATYLSAWVAFSLYSLPPFRWKGRGVLGVLCDASGAHLLPTLVAVILTFRAAHATPDPFWIAAIGAWAFANGVRGILWHQLSDVANDRTAGVRTFAALHERAAVRLGTFVAFPIEVLALAAILWRLHSPLPLLALAFYAYVAAKRLRHWSMNAVVVAPRPRFLIVLHEYYDVYLPLAVLAASAIEHPPDLAVLAIHCVIFPARLAQTWRDLAKLVRERRYPWR